MKVEDQSFACLLVILVGVVALCGGFAMIMNIMEGF